jgi:hypothetical protein
MFRFLFATTVLVVFFVEGGLASSANAANALIGRVAPFSNSRRTHGRMGTSFRRTNVDMMEVQQCSAVSDTLVRRKLKEVTNIFLALTQMCVSTTGTSRYSKEHYERRLLKNRVGSFWWNSARVYQMPRNCHK